MTELPSGTITFLFTDIEGSTKLLKQLGADRYGELLTGQRIILREAFETFNGTEIDTRGDDFFASFPRTTEAVSAAVQIQRSLEAHDWPENVEVRIRMGLHTGEPWLIEEGYVGMDVHRAARIGHVGHGGQVLLSETTTALVQDELPAGVTLLDLGRHRLKDMRRAEYIRQLVIEGLPDEFPPLNTLEMVAEPGATGGELGERPPREVGESPYRGLAAFQEEDAAFFFGRETFTEQLHDAIEKGSLVAVVLGSSGSGKSSTVFAGLLPRLHDERDWLILTLRPSTHPFHALATTLMPGLEPGLDETDSLFAIQKLADGLRTGEISLFHIIGRVLENQAGTNRLLLMLDQFEELYTLCPDPEIRQAFTDELLAAVESGADLRPNPGSIVVTLRADFMGQALTNRPFADAMQEGSLLLGPMNRAELQVAIEKPAEMQGAALEPGLVTRILDDVGEEPGNLPLLEFALTLLWNQMDQGWLTHDVYDEIGRVEGALARYADKFYEGLKPEEQEQARRIFIQLVQPGQGTEDTRRVARREDLVGVDWSLVQLLADGRLVVTGVDDGGKETVEVVHEALIRGWGQLREWMAADREFRNWQEGLRVALRGWENSGQDEGALLRGAPLVQARAWLETRSDDIGETEKNFILASEAYAQKRQRIRDHRRRLIIGGLVVGLVVAILLSVVAFSQQRVAVKNATHAENSAATAQAESIARGTQQALAEEQARVSQSRELAAASINNIGSDPERAILLALHALSTTHTLEAERALHQAVQSSHLRTTIHLGNTPSQPFWLTTSPDGQQVFISGVGGGSLWDLSTGQLGLSQSVKNPADWINSASFNSDGSVLILPYQELVDGGTEIVTEPGRIVLVDVETGEQILEFRAHDSSVGEVSMSPDGVLFATISDDRTAKIWNLTKTLAEGEGHLVRTLEIHDIGVGGFDIRGSTGARIIFSPDGDKLITKIGFDVATIWEVSTGTELGTLGPDIVNMVFNSDGQYLVTEGREGLVQVWDTQTGERLSAANSSASAFPSDIAFKPDDSMFATSKLNGEVIVWTFSPNAIQESYNLRGHTDDASGIAFSPDGKFLYSTSFDGTIRVWDVSPTGNSEFGGLVKEDVNDSRIINDGELLVTVGDDGTFRLWDTKEWEEILSIQAHEQGINAIDVSPDGTSIATASGDGTIKFWDTKTWQQISRIDAHSPEGPAFYDGAFDVEFSPDGQKLVSGGADDNMIKVWDVDSGELLYEMKSTSEWVIRTIFSPDGKYIAVGGGDIFNSRGTVTIYDADTGDLLLDIEPDDWIQVGRGFWGLDFSPDSSLLALGRTDSVYEVWKIPGEKLQVESGAQRLVHGVSGSGFILTLRFLDDGKSFVTAGGGGDLEVRSADDGELLLSLDEGPIWEIENTGDVGQIISIRFRVGIQILTTNLQELIDLAHSRVTRSLTAEECQTYLHVEECP